MTAKNSDILFGIKILSYAINTKISIVTVMFSFVGGLAMDYMTKGELFIGLYCMCLIPPYFSQLWNSVGISGVVQASVGKRRTLLSMPTKFYLLFSTIIYVSLIILRVVYYKEGKLTDTAMFGLLYFGVVTLMLTLYDVFYFRIPEFGYTVLFAIVVVMWFSGGLFSYSKGAVVTKVMPVVMSLPGFRNYIFTGIFGYMIMLLCTLVFYVLSRSMYRIPLSTRIYRYVLEKYRE